MPKPEKSIQTKINGHHANIHKKGNKWCSDMHVNDIRIDVTFDGKLFYIKTYMSDPVDHKKANKHIDKLIKKIKHEHSNFSKNN